MAASATSVRSPNALAMACASLTLNGLVPGWRANVRPDAFVVDLGARGRVTGRGSGTSETAVPIGSSRENQIHYLLRHVLDVREVIGVGGSVVPPDGVGMERQIIGLLRESDFDAHSGAAGTYHGTFHIDLTREEAAGMLPLRIGAAFQEGGNRVVVDDVRGVTGGVTLQLRRSNAQSAFDRRPPRRYSFYLRNRRLSNAVAGQAHPLLEGPRLFPFVGVSAATGDSDGFSVTSWLVQFPAFNRGDPSLRIDETWLAGAELIVVRATGHGSVVRTLEMPGFVIQKPAAQ